MGSIGRPVVRREEVICPSRQMMTMGIRHSPSIYTRSSTAQDALVYQERVVALFHCLSDAASIPEM